MYDDAKQIIAFLFARSGKKKLTTSELYLTLSMDLQWCSPKIAKEFVFGSHRLGLLLQEGNHFSPSFNTQDIDIPLAFFPSEKMFILSDQQKYTVIEKNKPLTILTERLLRKTSLSREQVDRMIQTIMEEKQLNFEAATALFARFHNVILLDVLHGLRNEIIKRCK
jgi:hypothetical protein